jgi:wyosine [tRNA(Phe)-imidazoG37] synthetase (radical SAM superfamily)
LAQNYPAEVIAAVENLANIKPQIGSSDCGYLANIILVDIYLGLGNVDGALASARKLFAARMCGTTQHLLYRSLKAKKESGHPVTNAEICIDDLSDRFCPRPFDTISTGSGGRNPTTLPPLYGCTCPGTVPYPIAGGQIEKTDVQNIWNGLEIKEIRRSILDGDFSYCHRAACDLIVSGSLPKRAEITDPHLRDIIENNRTHIDKKPAMITLGHDPSCNIACPSCRKELMTTKNSKRHVFDRLNENVLQPLIENAAVSLIISTDGDPIHSKSYRNLIHALDPIKNSQVRLMLITNGLLMTPSEWEAMANAHPMVAFIGVSIDGARKESYEELRWPGKWDRITENMEFLSKLRKSGKVPCLGLQFVVQKRNFEEMIEYVELGKQWNVDYIKFIRMLNMGSFAADTFEENDVCDQRHPLHPRFLEILRDPIFSDPGVDLFTIKPFHEFAQQENVDFGGGKFGLSPQPIVYK